jgi:uncharacterized OB-fold protein
MTTTISGSNGIVFPDATSMQTGQQAVKAWVNFNGTGVVAIRESYNVSSITDNGTGDYLVNFTTAMVDANYCAVRTVMLSGNPQTIRGNNLVSYVEVYVTNPSNGTQDPTTINVAVFR